MTAPKQPAAPVLPHGVPAALYTDRGSAFQGTSIKLPAAQVQGGAA